MSKTQILTIVSLGVCVLTGFLTIEIWKVNLPLISPIDVLESYSPLPTYPQTNKIVYGFLPYWNMKLTTDLNIRKLTHLAYFGIDLEKDGHIKKLDNPKEQEPGWTKLNSKAFDTLHRQLNLTNKKTTLVVRAMTRAQIESILDNPEYRTTAVDSILEIFTAKNFDGVNIDFESAGTYDEITRNNFTIFIGNLFSKCKMINLQCEISVDVLADSAVKTRLYDLKSLAKYLDHLIVMTYDYYRPSSSQAGPIAPLRGACNPNFPEERCLDYDVTASIADISKLVPSTKILLGVPFYGYQWQTTGVEFMSNTYDKTGALATYKRIRSLFTSDEISSFSAQWNTRTQSPYISFVDKDKIYQIHYEDTRSLFLKLQLVSHANLAGIAIWALGYETPHNDLWETIADNL